MDSGASNGDIFHGSRRPTSSIGFSRSRFKRLPASLWVGDRLAKATFPMVQGRQDFNSSKAGEKALKRGLLWPSTQSLSAFWKSLASTSLWSLTKSRWLRPQAEARLFPELNEPKRRFSWFKATFPLVDRAPSRTRLKNAPGSQASLRPRIDRRGSLVTLWAKATFLIVLPLVNSLRRHFDGWRRTFFMAQ